MNKEIKEILQKIESVANREIASRNSLMEMKDKDYQLLLDYITNLEKELELMVKDDEKSQKTIIKLSEEIQELRADYGNKAQVERDLLEDRINTALKIIEVKRGGYDIPDELERVLKGDIDE